MDDSNIKELKQNFDLDGSGTITPEEIDAVIKMRDYVNKDEKVDAQKQMAWVSLISMVCYPLLIVGASYFALDKAVTELGSMSGVFFGAVAAIVMVFIGAEAYKAKQ